jgi:hypothetical protein
LLPVRPPLIRWSPGTLCFKLYKYTFFVLQCSTQCLFQICNWVIIREVMVGNAKLVVTNFRFQPRPKTPNPFRKSLLPALSGTFRWKLF